MLPFDVSKVVQTFGAALVKMTNPFSPLLFANLILDGFSFAIFTLYRHIWIFIPALLLWILTSVVYVYLIRKSPHMLSSTTIQRYGMQMTGLGQNDKELDETKIDEMPATTDPSGPQIEGKLDEVRDK